MNMFFLAACEELMDISGMTEQETIEVFNGKTGVLIPVKPDEPNTSILKTDFEQRETSSGREINIWDEYHFKHRDVLEAVIHDDILNVEYHHDGSILKFLRTVEVLLKEFPETYGIIFKGGYNGGTTLNVIHPVIMNLIIEGKIKIPKGDAKFYIYNWDEEHPDYKVFPSIDQELVEKVIEDFIWFIEKSDETETDISVSRTVSSVYLPNNIDDIEDLQFNANSLRKFSIDFSENDAVNRKGLNFLIPLQLETKEFSIPYYGMTEVYFASNGEERNKQTYLGLSGNMKNCWYENSSSAVCCGSYSPKNLQGLYTLSNVNSNSVYFKSFVPKNIKSIVAGAIQVTTLLIDGYLNPDDEEENAADGE